MAAGRADLTDHDQPRVDTYPDGQRHARPRRGARAERLERGHDAESRAHRAGAVILVRPREAEVSEESVAQVLRDVAVEAADHVGAGALVGAHHLAQFLGIETGRKLRRAHQIAEHDGELPALGAGCRPR